MYRSSPNLMQRIHTAERIAAVVDVLAEEGIATAQALAGTGLDGSDLKSESTRVSYRQVEIAFRNTIALSRDPAVALRAGQRMHVMAFGMYGYALLSSPSRAEGIDFVAKYSRILGTIADVAFARDDDTATLTLEPLLPCNPADDVYRFALEFTFAAHQTMSRDIYGQSFGFSRLSAAYSEPAHAGIYRQLFRCPITFDQPSNGLEFDVDWIDHPLVCPDLTTYVTAAEMCEQLLGTPGRRSGVAAEIRRTLLERPGHFPGIDAMATELSMHPRTLRRRLEAEQITYRDVVAEVRMKLAVGYLRNTRMTNEEIAARLDYSDAANFRHAFTRWTGKSPSAFRGAW